MIGVWSGKMQHSRTVAKSPMPVVALDYVLPLCRLYMMLVQLLLGTNQGDRLANIRVARQFCIDTLGQLKGMSNIYESAPWGVENQDDYLNQAISIETTLHPEVVLLLTKQIERSMGRVRRQRWEPRIIDIDLLNIEGMTYASAQLQVPHPLLTQRLFALRPLFELTPKLVILPIGETVDALLQACPDQGALTLFSKE